MFQPAARELFDGAGEGSLCVLLGPKIPKWGRGDVFNHGRGHDGTRRDIVAQAGAGGDVVGDRIFGGGLSQGHGRAEERFPSVVVRTVQRGPSRKILAGPTEGVVPLVHLPS